MTGQDVRAFFQIGDGSGDLQNAMIRPGGKAQPGRGLNQQLLSAGIKGTMAPEIHWPHLTVEIHRGSPGKTSLLNGMGFFYPGLDCR